MLPQSLRPIVSRALAVLACAGLAAPTAVPAAPAPQPLALTPLRPVGACAALTRAEVSRSVGARTVVTAAAAVDDGKAAPFCKLSVTIDDYAKFTVNLPTTGWNQRLLFGGGPGAQVGSAMKTDAFVTVAWEDLGRRPNEDLLANQARAQVNAGYRGMHWQVLAAKALIAAFYGRGPRFSYYNACSNPGREGLIEIQRYPDDFDGVGAGCPPLNTTVNNGLWHAWNVLSNTGPAGEAILTADKLPILHQAMLARCDAADGARDAIISDPFACDPGPAIVAVTCVAGADPAGCLTAAQAGVARRLYAGAHDPAGARIIPGVLPGSELAWTATIVPSGQPFGGPDEARLATARALRSHYSFPALAPDWPLSQAQFTRASLATTTRLSGLHDGTNTDLSGFARSGGKLMLWMALGDTNVMPAQAILYYQRMRAQMGATAADGFSRFYLLPGVYHCGGGDGPVIANLLLPLMLWVERGIAPEAVDGVHVPRRPGGPGQGAGSGQPPAAPDLTRPIYPYPFTARYDGSGDVRDAANWVKGPARPVPTAAVADWPGAALYRPGATRWCADDGKGITCKPPLGPTGF